MLDSGEALRLSKVPGTLYRELALLSPGDWAVIDEVQKAPALLDEVHRLMETRKLRFVLSGASARKLRRGGANLLAGRAATLAMLPLTCAEMKFDVDLARLVRFGTLPMAVTAEDPAAYLRSYAETYLVHEVQAEALTRNVGAFARFLEVAARQNGQQTNAASIARDVGVARRTVQNHFDILIDTLLGFVAVEIKASANWQNRFNRGLLRVSEALGKTKTACYGVYLGDRAALWGNVTVLPVLDFVERLWDGAILR